MSDIEDRLLMSARLDAVNGDHHERMVCAKQMVEGANLIKTQRSELQSLRDKLRESEAKISEFENAKSREKLWCAYCGAFGNHQSGGCDLIKAHRDLEATKAKLARAVEAMRLTLLESNIDKGLIKLLEQLVAEISGKECK